MSASTADADPSPSSSGESSGGVRPDQRVVTIHRIGAVVVALVIAAFGVLGLIGGLGFFDTQGASVAGLSSNGLLSTVSLVTAVVLVAAAVRGGRFASTVMIVIGVLFLVSAFGNLAVMGTSVNFLAFRLPNVFFSIGAGLVLLLLGAYGRVSGKLPSDNPYAMANQSGQAGDESEQQDIDSSRQIPSNAAEQAADREMADATRAVATGVATEEQQRRVAHIDTAREHAERRRLWIDSAPTASE